jgi:transglutaminase-like putative cysteine protease
MPINRRDVLKAGGALAAASALPSTSLAQAGFAPKPGAWRSFETVARLEIAKPSGQVQAWVPLPALDEPEWFRPTGSTWTTNARTAEKKRDTKYGAEFLHLVWADGEAAPVVEVLSKFSTRDRAVDLSQPGKVATLADADRKLYTMATALIPIDGIVKETSDKITAGARDDLDKARRIYEWVVDNTFRDPKTRGCGVGDVASMLNSGNLGGKCADLNALYVGLARAAGLPARDVYGLRVVPSQFGYKSLGAGSEVVTKAQHCRAEVFLTGFG